jgi:hypothetical protein
MLEWTELGRVRADEQYLERRRLNVQNFGSTWLKPPGVTKTLHQLREEKREQEEHQEALRREQLAQELADAETAGGDGVLQGEGMDDVQLDGARDLDDDIPDADASGLGLDLDDDDDDDEEGEDDEAGAGEEIDEEAQREERRHDLMAQRMRMTDDAFREALARGEVDGEAMYGGEEEPEDEGLGADLLDEDDLTHIDGHGLGLDEDDDGLDMDMDANLDDDIPEAASGGYEHTDSEAELSSSSDEDDDDDDDDMGFVPRAAPLGPPQSPLLGSRARPAGGARASLDLSSMLSRDGSSVLGSSPQVRRQGPGRQ